MSSMRISILVVVASVSLAFITSAFAQEAGKAGTLSSAERQLEKEKELRQRLEKKQELPPVEEPAVEQPQLPQSSEKVMVTDITVSGVTQFSNEEIEAIVAPSRNTELTLPDMQKLADRITDLYRSNGFITSRAYLPPQKIAGGVLEIRVIEGTTGKVEVSGNRFFRATRIKRSLEMKEGEIFNHNDLRKNLTRVNEQPDRNVKAVLAPGTTPGATDINLEVKDRFPVHAEVGWDNWGSRYIRKNHYNGVLTDNNLLGFDDVLTAQYQFSDAQDYDLLSLRYLFPVTPRLRIGAYASRSQMELGQEYKDVMARSKSKMASIYGMYDIVAEENSTVTLNLGFDYKDNFNFQLGEEESRDRLRVPRIGVDIDITDRWRGRTIIAPELNVGIPHLMDGLESVDPVSSRDGAGGEFVKGNVMFARLQDLPLDMSLLWKNQLQVTPHILTATEQFQLGGVANNRGYASGELVGDNGGASSIELSVPVYGIPKDLKYPFMKETIYDSLRLAAFYDWGFVYLHNPQVTEHKHSCLNSIGYGVRVNLPRNFSFTVDFGWPVGDVTPSDESHLHTWLSIAKKF